MNELKGKNKNSVFICPKNCNYIPEIEYSYELFNPLIKYKCHHQSHEFIEDKMKLGDFLQRTSFNIQCFLCKFLIIDKEFIYSKNNKMFYHINCLKNSRNIKNNEYIKVDSNYLFNYCLNHNNKFVFYCKECKLSLCSLCDINFHNDKDHLLQQIISLRKNKNKEDNFKIIINKQRDLLNEIKEIYNKLFQSLENDIIIKEKILVNYKKNYYNYESIQNFNNLELKNN